MRFLELKVPPVGLTILSGVLMYLLDSVVPGASFNLPGAIWFAAACLLVGIAFGVPSVQVFRRAGTTVNPFTPDVSSTLVVDGIYRYSRNPMYVALVFVLAAWAVYLGNGVAALVIPAFVLYMTQFQIKPEERALLERFGTNYADYMKSARRWL